MNVNVKTKTALEIVKAAEAKMDRVGAEAAAMAKSLGLSESEASQRARNAAQGQLYGEVQSALQTAKSELQSELGRAQSNLAVARHQAKCKMAPAGTPIEDIFVTLMRGASTAQIAEMHADALAANDQAAAWCIELFAPSAEVSPALAKQFRVAQAARADSALKFVAQRLSLVDGLEREIRELERTSEVERVRFGAQADYTSLTQPGAANKVMNVSSQGGFFKVG